MKYWQTLDNTWELGGRGGKGGVGEREEFERGKCAVVTSLLVLINTHHFKLVCGNNNLNQINNSKCVYLPWLLQERIRTGG